MTDTDRDAQTIRGALESAFAAEERAEALAGQLQQAREALQGLLDAAEAEVGPKLGEPDKNAEYWAALDPDKHVPGVARRVALAHAVIVVRAALAATAPATTPNEPEQGERDPTLQQAFQEAESLAARLAETQEILNGDDCHAVTHLFNQAMLALQDGELTEARARLSEAREAHNTVVGEAAAALAGPLNEAEQT